MISGKILKPYHFTHQNSHNLRLTGSKQDSVPPSYPQTTNQPLFLNCKYSEEKKKKKSWRLKTKMGAGARKKTNPKFTPYNS